MLSLLFSKDMFIAVGAIVLVVLCFIGYKKSKELRGLFKFFAIVICLAVTTYSGYQIYFYTTTHSKIFGTYNAEKMNNKVAVSKLEFDFRNLEMLATGNGDEYAVSIYSEDAFSLTSQNYVVSVNGAPIDYVDISETGDYIIAKYQYNFYNDYKEIICSDTLTMRFALSKKNTNFTITTQGGSDAVRLWNSYFNKNGFLVSLTETENLYNPDISYGDGEVEYAVARYYVGEELYLTQVYHVGDIVNLPTYSDYRFNGWALEPTGNAVSELTITEDLTLYAKLDKTYTNNEYLDFALNNMQNGVLDLSPYPIERIPAKSESNIEYGYFEYNQDIVEVICPSTLLEIGYKAFYGCNNLSKITFNEGLKKIGENAFETAAFTSIVIPSSVQEIGAYAFCNTSLERVVLEDCSAIIRNRAFSSCSNLTTMYIPASVTTIYANSSYLDSIVKGCSNYLKIYCGAEAKPEGWGEYWNYLDDKNVAQVVYSISRDKFEYMIENGLTEIKSDSEYLTIALRNMQNGVLDLSPYPIERIPANYFSENENIQEVIFPKTLKEIGNNAFGYCSSIRKVTFNEGLEIIGEEAFTFTYLTTVLIPGSVKEIKKWAFSCSAIKNVILHEGIQTLYASVFADCKYLESIYIPESVTVIQGTTQSQALVYGSVSTVKIYCGATEVQTSWNTYFNNLTRTETAATYFGYSLEDYLQENPQKNYYLVKYFANNKQYKFEIYAEGDLIVLPRLSDEGFVGWALSEGGNVVSNLYATEDLNLYAKIAEVEKYGLFSEDGILLSAWSELKSMGAVYVNSGTLSLIDMSMIIQQNSILKISDEVISWTITAMDMFDGCIGIVVPSSVKNVRINSGSWVTVEKIYVESTLINLDSLIIFLKSYSSNTEILVTNEVKEYHSTNADFTSKYNFEAVDNNYFKIVAV